MKTIGLIGGMSWVSTLEYYRLINEEAQRRLGELHSARVIINSVDFGPLAGAQKINDWDSVTGILSDAGVALERAGADFLLIGANTMHRVADAVQSRLRIPLIHIADVVRDVICDRGLQRIGLLGTRATMEQKFYSERLAGKGLEILTPPAAERERLDRLIFGELCRGVVTEQAGNILLSTLGELQERGAQGVILGCTELGSIPLHRPPPVPLFDSTRIHALKAVDLACQST